MTFREKLTRLAAAVNKSEAGRKAGLGATTISNYLAKGSVPRIDIGLKIARALNVPLEWLADDEQGWPPPPCNNNSSATTEELAVELGRRMSGVGYTILAKIERARKIDWVKIAEKLLPLEPDATLPRELREAVELPGQLNALRSELYRFDARVKVDADAPPEILRDVGAGFEFGVIELWTWEGNLKGRPGYELVFELARIFTIPEGYRPEWFAENVKATKDKVAKALAELPKQESKKKR